MVGYDFYVSSACSVLRYLPTLVMCGGLGVVVVSIFGIRTPAGVAPPISPAMQCSIWLTVLFFVVFVSLWLASSTRNMTYGQFHGQGTWMDRLVHVLWSLTGPVHFCPMLAILFVALRMRALQVTQQTGHPQGWAQDTMYVCTVAVFLQILVCLTVSLQNGPPEKIGWQRVAVTAGSHTVLSKAMVFLQVSTSLVILVGVVVICAACWIITPETAGAKGAWLGL